MPTQRKNINHGNVGATTDFKIQPYSADDGTYVDVVALDADLGVSIGMVTQGTAASVAVTKAIFFVNGTSIPVSGEIDVGGVTLRKVIT